MPKVSIIVPVYNAEQYIEKMLKSLLNQTLKDIEIILINDGSQDNSLSILRNYEKKYSNIIVVNQKNGGPSVARNSGLRIAKGEFVAFVDSDDYVGENMYENLYHKAIEGDFDIVECNYMYTDGENNWQGVRDIKSDITSLKEKKKYMVNFYPVLWNKIYKHNKIKNIYFTEGVFAEDVEYLYRVLPVIDKIGYINKVGYYYLQRQNSESNNYDNRLYDYITNFNNILKYYKENNFYDIYIKEIEFCYVRYLYATFIKRVFTFDKTEFSKALDLAIKNVKENVPKYYFNKYFYKSIKGIYLLLFNKYIGQVLYFVFHK